jgi:hypothetical protein
VAPQAAPPAAGYGTTTPQAPPAAGYGTTPPPSYQPPPPVYPATPPPPAHKLSGAVIAGIIALVVLIAGGVTAAFVLTGGSSKSAASTGTDLGNGNLGNNPTPGPTPTAQPTTAPTEQPTTQPTTAPTEQPTSGPTPGPSPQPTPVDNGGGGIDLGSGVSVTPAAGWQVAKQTSNRVVLISGDGNYLFDTTVGQVQSGDISQVITSDIQNWAQGAQDLKVGQSSGVQQIQGNHFSQMIAVPYEVVLSGQQGTITLYGTFIELMDPQSRLAAFVVFGGGDQNPSQDALNGAKEMLNSMA